MTAESFGGRYIPIFATQIVDMNREKILTAEKEDREVKKEELINLKKIAIGNGLTDIATQTPYYYDLWVSLSLTISLETSTLNSHPLLPLIRSPIPFWQYLH